jgi:hypothetical protein
MHWRTHQFFAFFTKICGAKPPTTLKTNTLYIYTWRKEASPSRDADGECGPGAELEYRFSA